MLTGKQHVTGVFVFCRVNGREGYAKLNACLHDAYGDFAAVGDENPVLLQNGGFRVVLQIQPLNRYECQKMRNGLDFFGAFLIENENKSREPEFLDDPFQRPVKPGSFWKCHLKNGEMRFWVGDKSLKSR